jgi:hypothetical protein
MRKKPTSKEKKPTPKEISRWSLFGPPPILEGEDAAAYDELFGRVFAAVKPVDAIDEMFMADVVASEWEALRWRRLKLSLIRARALQALEGYLAPRLDSRLCREQFTYDPTRILQDNLAEDQAEDFATLAREFARNKPDAVDKVNNILAGIGMHPDNILRDAEACKAMQIVQQYVRREPGAVKMIHGLLATYGVSIETLTVKALPKELDYIERIDRQVTIAESRRDASLREIDRRRPILGETLRRSVQEAEDREFKVIEARPAKEKNAA